MTRSRSSTRHSDFCPTRTRWRPSPGRIFAGHLRSIIGSMTVEEIITERQKLASEVLDGSKEEMAKIGLIVDALQIQSIDDGGLGYIKAMAAPHNARIQQAAQIAQAAADQAAAEAQQQSLRKQAEFERDTAVTRAGYAAETQAAEQKASQAGPLAQAQAQQEVIDEQTRLAQRQAESTSATTRVRGRQAGRGGGRTGPNPRSGPMQNALRFRRPPLRRATESRSTNC